MYGSNGLLFDVFTGDRLDMRTDCNRIDVDGVDVHWLVAVSRLATRLVFSLHRGQRANAVAV